MYTFKSPRANDNKAKYNDASQYAELYRDTYKALLLIPDRFVVIRARRLECINSGVCRLSIRETVIERSTRRRQTL